MGRVRSRSSRATLTANIVLLSGAKRFRDTSGEARPSGPSAVDWPPARRQHLPRARARLHTRIVPTGLAALLPTGSEELRSEARPARSNSRERWSAVSRRQRPHALRRLAPRRLAA